MREFNFKNYLSEVLNHKLFLSFVILVCIYTMGRQSDKYFGWTNPKNTLSENLLSITSDGAGYYAYLPQWYIYPEKKEFSFIENITTKYNTYSFVSGISYDFQKHKGTDKYYIGTSICMTPFFLINHAIQKKSSQDADGYSKSYQCTVSISTLFYWLLGILGLIVLLKRFKISNFSISIVILIISLGTNLNYYTVYLPSFSHTYSFCAITWFLYFSKHWVDTQKSKSLIYLSLLLGLIFIIRPTNILVVLFIPFLFKNWKAFYLELLTFREKKTYFIISIIVFFIPVLLQIFNIHSQIGKWTLNTYTNEHFDYLTNPKMREVLFGYRKGFFTYAPIMFLLIPSLWFLRKKGNYFVFGWISVFLLFIYLTSSWWCWWYGGGLGMRTFIDFLSFLIIPIALLLKYISDWLKIFILAFITTTIWIYQIFQIQFKMNIIHYDVMTKETFWHIFLKTDKRMSWVLHFKEYKINEHEILDCRKINLLPNFDWVENEKSSEKIVLKSTIPDPRYIFIPDPKWDNTTFGIQLKGQMMISDPVSNPSLIINIYNQGKISDNKEIFIGNQLDHLKEYLDFKREYKANINYQSIDSVEIIMTKGAPKTGIQNISCIFFSLKKSK